MCSAHLSWPNNLYWGSTWIIGRIVKSSKLCCLMVRDFGIAEPMSLLTSMIHFPLPELPFYHEKSHTVTNNVNYSPGLLPNTEIYASSPFVWHMDGISDSKIRSVVTATNQSLLKSSSPATNGQLNGGFFVQMESKHVVLWSHKAHKLKSEGHPTAHTWSQIKDQYTYMYDCSVESADVIYWLQADIWC